jgi:hypothetical protein
MLFCFNPLLAAYEGIIFRKPSDEFPAYWQAGAAAEKLLTISQRVHFFWYFSFGHTKKSTIGVRGLSPAVFPTFRISARKIIQ